jgi:pimeloyl-ACP methyl ester carboxylesterase
MASVTRFLRQYLRPSDDAVITHSLTYTRGAEQLPAVVFRPAHARGPLPGWVLLHGLTYQALDHPSLIRFGRAVAASGSIVFVPEIPEWKQLRVAPAITTETIATACIALHELDGVNHERTGVIGFSFGATQALIAACDPAVERAIRGIAAWGGYAELHRVFRFGILGDHELDGVKYHMEPDPYGAWIMGGNYVCGIPGHEDSRVLAESLHRLAITAGQSRVYAWDPKFDPLKRELRAMLPPHDVVLFDVLARPSGGPIADPALANKLANDLADAALRIDPLLDPTAFLPRVRVRTLVAHGRDDRLVPFTESVRLARALSAAVARDSVTTALFAHSGGTRPDLGRIGVAREGVRFTVLLKRILDLI